MHQPRLLRTALLALSLAACGTTPVTPDGDVATDAQDAPPSDGPSNPDGHSNPGDLPSTIERGTATPRTTPRETFGALKIRAHGERTYALETRRDREYNPSRRFVAYGPSHEVLWQFAEGADEMLSDFAVHPSGEVTLGVIRHNVERRGYDLVRLRADGSLRARQLLPDGATLPAGDLGTNLPSPPFRMIDRHPHALTDGWLRVEARGDGLIAAFLSRVAIGNNGVDTPALASGLMALRFADERYDEVWTRVVDGSHSSGPALWAYDEFRWREAAQRPILAVTDDGRIAVGRTWSESRCRAAADTFQEFTRVDCYDGERVNSGADVRYQPFAYTLFTADGAREGTRTFVGTSTAAFVVFDMAARGDAIALVGTAARAVGDGIEEYPDGAARFVAYNAYVTVLDRATARPRFEQLVDMGRGDYLAALRWTEQGIVAVGASGWDRGQGGMSVFRGASPLFVYASSDGAVLRSRVAPMETPGRHNYLLSVDVRGNAVTAGGLSDAPMTHSGDGGQDAQMAFGGLGIELR